MNECFENKGMRSNQDDQDVLADSIDPASLERLARIARGFPGCTISLNQAHDSSTVLPREEQDGAILRIDGVVAAEFVEQYEGN